MLEICVEICIVSIEEDEVFLEWFVVCLETDPRAGIPKIRKVWF